MKKIIKLGVVFFLFVSLAGCGSKVNEDAIDAYISASQNMMNMKTADYSVTLKANEEESNVAIKAYGAYDARSDLKLNMMIDMDMMEGSFTNVGELYIHDYVVYLNALGEKEAYSFKEYESMLSYLLESTSAEVDREKIKNMFSSAELKDGHLYMIADAEGLGIEDQLTNSLGSDDTMDMNFSEMKFDITIENNFMINMIVDAVITMDNTKEPITMNFHMTIGFTNINTDRTMGFPDFSGYTIVEDIQLDEDLSEIY